MQGATVVSMPYYFSLPTLGILGYTGSDHGMSVYLLCLIVNLFYF